MRRFARVVDLFRWAAIGAAVWLLPAVSSAQGPLAAMVDQGRKLFEHEFAPREGATPLADGLGPMFNHVSCAGCHKQGGIGGGGPVDVNAELLSAVMPPVVRPKKAKPNAHLAPLRKIHPAFVSEDGEFNPNLVLHRFSTDLRYGVLREQLTGKSVPFNPSPAERDVLQKELARTPLANAKVSPGFRLLLTQRNTPALFGSGVIDAISDETLLELVVAQQRGGEVSGRVPPVDNRRAGRFGWRGQTERLHDFVLNACANELGLEVPGVAQPVTPQKPDYKAPGLDLTEQQCDLLVAFVASLPPPKIVWPEEATKRNLAGEGQKLFRQVGCAACHVEDVGPAQAIYSDLLLHDLGPGLADPVLASPSPHQVSSVQPAPNPPSTPGQSRRSGYSGGHVPNPPLAGSRRQANGMEISQTLAFLPEDLTQEWRTPPLWGLADSAPYLHDGRAETALEAIAWHGGEARKSSEAFFALPAPERMKVLEFLACLKAPQ